MMNILGKIFGSKGVIDAGIKSIDAMVFTDEEKSKLHLQLLKQYEPFKIAQRYLAFMFSGIFLLVYLNAVILWNVGVFTSDIDMQGFYMSVAFELAEWNTKMLGIAIGLIIGFYFAGGAISSISKSN